MTPEQQIAQAGADAIAAITRSMDHLHYMDGRGKSALINHISGGAHSGAVMPKDELVRWRLEELAEHHRGLHR